ncbi:hypothetical protein CMI47_17670 [Candidatus Pacearchaeota archaeon]|nr:hypothetical protein [Candidatus Pacearchaeota archaeon]|tara:strand:- start:16832 stop:17170 length:339 start_codon:yes stop_codon:yes gene_type:complete
MKEGRRIFDNWSFAHLVGGGFLSGAAFFFGVHVLVGFVIVLGLMIGWELFEKYRKVGESLKNKISDVVFGSVGYFGMWGFLDAVSESLGIQVLVVVGIAFVWLLVGVLRDIS